jgi:diguanylate cyclase (GGDEF)-like protein
VDDDEIHMQLFYDDGEYFNDIRVKREGTLSDWVINNQRPLFLPDLRQTVVLEGVRFVMLGKQKGSLSWMGVPMRGTHVDGVMVIGSYRPNAFDRSDLELLSNIAQRAVLALDNTYHHGQVQKEAQLDSLTRVYNHGHFIQVLQDKAELCRAQKQPLSLIMLDIDHFKKYNDGFGHQTGDEILVRLCEIIRKNIKQMDLVGRWGGEEFAIALPNTNGEQAVQIAQRIRETLASLKLNRNKEINLPVPTVSQGIALLNEEMNDISKLISLADKRLYIAKDRGRDQIEPPSATS